MRGHFTDEATCLEERSITERADRGNLASKCIRRWHALGVREREISGAFGRCGFDTRDAHIEKPAILLKLCLLDRKWLPRIGLTRRATPPCIRR